MTATSGEQPFDVVDVLELSAGGRVAALHIVYDTADVRPAFEQDTGKLSWPGAQRGGPAGGDPAAADQAAKEPAAADLASAGPARRFRLVAGFAEHDERFGSSVAIEVQRETAPTRAEPVQLV